MEDSMVLKLMYYSVFILLGVSGFFQGGIAEEPTSISPSHQVILKGEWTPSMQDTQKALATAAVFVRETGAQSKGAAFLERYRIEQARKISQDFAYYAVQFIGEIRNGKKVIFCNFFPTSDLNFAFSYWKNVRVSVMDGGSSFWQIDYDPKTGKCDGLLINGEG